MLSIVGMGYKHASVEMGNQFLEDLGIDSSAEWIIDKIGIESRLVSLPLEYIEQTRNVDFRKALEVSVTNCTELGTAAARGAIERAGITSSDIGLVLTNCCTPSKLGQSEAQRIARNLGMDCIAHDLFSACPAFAIHMDYLNNFEEDSLPDYILCISTATISQKVNYNEKSDGAIWGDGASAWIVSPRKPGRLMLRDTFFASDCTRCQAVVINRFGHFTQDGRAVRDFSVRQTVRLIKAMEEKYELDWNRDIFIGHQANYTMLRQITGNRNIPPTNHWYNVVGVGNQAGAGCGAVLCQNWDNLQSGQNVLIAVVGAGLSWGSVLLQAA